MTPEKTKQIEFFEGDEQFAAEYSVHRTCPLSGSGFHCSCYDDKPRLTDTGNSHGGECCICEEINQEFLAEISV